VIEMRTVFTATLAVVAVGLVYFFALGALHR
jgi:hypothetical protein